ncbi:LysR substrate-binding domain-containing protein [Streptomyces sp. NPDC102365]|uniref:LysR substrate-binding domain-containing protein n=1 Tax=Streptomyces sp. NPDC102365 TaxID=3366162 RepID=UPI00380EF525
MWGTAPGTWGTCWTTTGGRRGGHERWWTSCSTAHTDATQAHPGLSSPPPPAGRRTLAPADLAEEPWVGSEWPGPCLDARLSACEAAGFRPTFVVESEDYVTAQGFVAAGLGVSLAPRLGLGSRHPGVVVREVRRPEPVRAISAAVREAAGRAPALRSFLQALREAGGDGE